MVLTDINGRIEQNQYLVKIAELEKQNKDLQDEISELYKQLNREIAFRISAEQDKMML